MQTISVHFPSLPASGYQVRIGPRLLSQLGAFVFEVAAAPSCGLITDDHVAAHYLAAAKASLESAGFRVIHFVIPPGEASKNLQTAAAALDRLLLARVERATPIIALGGGVVGDLGGFVAATLLRGVPFIQVPTTLLAAVDASVGGKVGIDHPAGKNLIGAFHQPRLVLADTASFNTLPDREMRCGLAECIKHGIIRDLALFDFIAAHAAAIANRDEATLVELVAWNVKIKAAIVAEDPFEHGVRALLNLGHTFGHALETVAGYRGLQHGEAVALGMIAATRLAEAQHHFPPADTARIVDLIKQVGLPVHLEQIDVPQVFAAMATDKKVQAGKLRLVLPAKIGAAHIVDSIPAQAIRTALASLASPA